MRWCVCDDVYGVARFLADRFVEGTCPLCAYEVSELCPLRSEVQLHLLNSRVVVVCWGTMLLYSTMLLCQLGHSVAVCHTMLLCVGCSRRPM